MWVCHVFSQTDWKRAPDRQLEAEAAPRLTTGDLICLARYDPSDVDLVQDLERLAALGYAIKQRAPRYDAVHRTTVVYYLYALRTDGGDVQGAPILAPRPWPENAPTDGTMAAEAEPNET